MRRWRVGVPLAAILLLALALRTDTWWYPHTLFGVMEYDDGVYYAASRLLLSGHLPYRDFTIVHPPVLALALTPAAAIGAVFGDPVGIVAARVEIQLVALANVLLVHRLARHLPGRSERTALVAAGLYAVMPDSVLAGHTVLLEPLVTAACLAGVLGVLQERRRWVFVGGVLLAAGIGIKVFGGVYVVALLLWVAAGRRWRLLPPYVGGLVLGGLVLIAPFAVAAPGAMWHDVVVTQLSRPRNFRVAHGLARVADMAGLGYATVPAAMVLLALVLGAAVLAVRRQRDSTLVVWLTVLGLAGLAFVRSPSYFPHYGDFLAPALVLVCAWAATVIAWQRWVVAAMALAFLVGVGRDVLHQQGQTDLRARTALVPRGSCVWSDAVSLTLAAGLFREPSRDCPGWIDGRGVALTQNTDWPAGTSYYPQGLVADMRWQAATVAQMEHADWLLLRGSPASFPEWAQGTRSYVLQHFSPVWVEKRRELWRRVSPQQ